MTIPSKRLERPIIKFSFTVLDAFNNLDSSSLKLGVFDSMYLR